MALNYPEYVGKKFGKWTIVKFLGKNKSGHEVALCKCDCGVEKEVKFYTLKQGSSSNCGCNQKGRLSEKRLFYKGKIIGNFKILKDLPTKNGYAFVLAQCLCGNKKELYLHKLKGKRPIISCGCIFHKMTGTKEYKAWSNMKNRCLNPNWPKFKNYGGRGITVCEEWFDFRNFFNDMGKAPKNLTLERKNNNKGYSKENCIWATISQQNYNRRTKKEIENGN